VPQNRLARVRVCIEILGFGPGDFTLLPKLAAELVNLPADIIVADNGLGVLASKTHTTPIVAIMGDPMASGLVASLSRPGGNVTGFTLMHKELSAKRLEMLHAAFPDISAVAVLRNPAGPLSATSIRATEEAARSIGSVTVATVLAGSIEDLLALRPAVLAGVGGPNSLATSTDMPVSRKVVSCRRARAQQTGRQS
jgi:ABC-type uncharacterized transport system substrate-binding protein